MFINLAQVKRLLKQRKPIDFTAEEMWVFERFFEGRMPPRGFHTLMREGGGRFKSFSPSSNLCKQGKRVESLMLIVAGSDCDVLIDGEIVSTLSPSAFVGEMCFLEGLGGRKSFGENYGWAPRFLRGIIDKASAAMGVEVAAATVKVGKDEPCRCLCWNQEKLNAFMKRDDDVSNRFEAMLASDLVQKLRGNRNGNSKLTVPEGNRGVSRKVMAKAREGGGVTRGGIFLLRIKDAISPLSKTHKNSESKKVPPSR